MQEEKVEPNKGVMESTKRPVIVTVICVVGLFGVIVNVPLIFSEAANSVAAWYPLFLGFTTIVALVSFVGLWKMKKWAAYTYIGGQVLGIVVLSNMDMLEMHMILISALIIAVMLSQLKKMK